MKTHLAALSEAITTHTGITRSLAELNATLEEKNNRLEALQSGGQEGDMPEMVTLSAQCHAIPLRVKTFTASISEAHARVVSLAGKALVALEPQLQSREAAMRGQAAAAVLPFCANQQEVLAVVDSFSRIHELNHLARELAHDLENRDASSAVSRIKTLLEPAVAAEEGAPTVMES